MQGAANMLESGFIKEGQSPETVDGGKLASSRKWCGWSRRHGLFFILVLGVVLFFYNTDIRDMAPDWDPKWWMQPTKMWIPYKIQRPKVVSANTTAGFTTENGSSTLPHAENITANQTTNASVVSQHTTQKRPVPPTPVPYVSPGPYVVEYPYEYNFVINEPKKCEQQKPFVVLMVPVAPSNRAHRDIVRSTWGGEGLVQGKVVTLFFVLGLHAGEGAKDLQEQLLQESREHQDLLQSDFLDCYKNLTIKTMVMLEWLDAHCSGATYAMKIDSDTFLNVPNLINMLLNAPKANYMTGLVARGAVVLRDLQSKWYLPRELYPHAFYPPYALGLGYVLSLDLPKKLKEASRHVTALYIEDVYLGLCMQHLGIRPTDPPSGGDFHVFPVQYSRCAYSRLIVTTTNGNTDRVSTWKDFKSPGPYC